MPRFNSIKFYQNRPKIKLVFVINGQNFRVLGAPPPDPRKSPPPLQISGYAPEFNHVFALLIFMSPEFYLKPDFKSINFYQNKAKINLFLQKKIFFLIAGAPHPDPQWYSAKRAELPDPRKSPSPLQIFGYSPDIKRVM